PSRSARWPSARRVRMKAAANSVKAGHAAHPRATNSRAPNAVIAPKPTLLKADATPGTHTAAITFMRPAWARGVDWTRASGATNARVAIGRSVVASAMAAKP